MAQAGRCPNLHVIMLLLKCKVTLLPLGAPPRFVGVVVPPEAVAADLLQMRNILQVRAPYYEECFRTRYSGSYHVTLINSQEFRDLDPHRVAGVLGTTVSLELLGLGRASAEGTDCFFTVCRSTEMESLRARLVSSIQDFHVTLGFDGSDLHGVRKDLSTLVTAYCQASTKPGS